MTLKFSKCPAYEQSTEDDLTVRNGCFCGWCLVLGSEKVSSFQKNIKTGFKKLKEENEKLKSLCESIGQYSADKSIEYFELRNEYEKIKAENEEINLRLFNRNRELNEALKKLDDVRVEENRLRKALSEKINKIEQLKVQLQQSKCPSCNENMYCLPCVQNQLYECTKRAGW
jgi:DNA repair exonuclease SbcCD ATPase subunit